MTLASVDVVIVVVATIKINDACFLGTLPIVVLVTQLFSKSWAIARTMAMAIVVLLDNQHMHTGSQAQTLTTETPDDLTPYILHVL